MHEKYRVLIMAVLLTVSVFLTYYFHAVLMLGTVFSHFFYIPIIISALWWEKKSILVAMSLAGLVVASSLLFRPEDLTLNDYFRALMFIVIAFVVATLSDQLKGQQRTIQREKDRIQTILNTAGVLLVIINTDQTIGLVNRRGSELLGFSEAELIEKNWFDTVVPERHREEARQAFARIMAGDASAFDQKEMPIVSREGKEYTVLWQDSALRDETGAITGFLCSGKDITDRIQAEEALRVANEDANLYLDIMAHDINNANAVALGYSDLLVETLNGQDRDMVRKLRSGIQRSIEIIQNVSTIRRLRSQDCTLQTVDLDEIIRAEISHHPDADIVYDGTPVLVAADDLLPEVFTNLIGNSLKFGAPDVRVSVKVAEDGEDVEVTVEDTGPGVPNPMKSRIFSRFTRGRTTKSGKGLGLFIARMLVERYGGTIRADDRVTGRPEAGAAFRFTLRKIGRPAARCTAGAPVTSRC